jgi:hypothetical protein
MTERESQSGDGEVAICHVCNKEFSTQEKLLAHLNEQHEAELLT